MKKKNFIFSILLLVPGSDLAVLWIHKYFFRIQNLEYLILGSVILNYGSGSERVIITSRNDPNPDRVPGHFCGKKKW